MWQGSDPRAGVPGDRGVRAWPKLPRVDEVVPSSPDGRQDGASSSSQAASVEEWSALSRVYGGSGDGGGCGHRSISRVDPGVSGTDDRRIESERVMMRVTAAGHPKLSLSGRVGAEAPRLFCQMPFSRAIPAAPAGELTGRALAPSRWAGCPSAVDRGGLRPPGEHLAAHPSSQRSQRRIRRRATSSARRRQDPPASPARDGATNPGPLFGILGDGCMRAATPGIRRQLEVSPALPPC
jgi:hypothetical protein